VGDARTISAAHARGEAMRKSEQPLCLRANDKVNRYMNPPRVVPKVRLCVPGRVNKRKYFHFVTFTAVFYVIVAENNSTNFILFLFILLKNARELCIIPKQKKALITKNHKC
jgi:hypothetical protein